MNSPRASALLVLAILSLVHPLPSLPSSSLPSLRVTGRNLHEDDSHRNMSGALLSSLLSTASSSASPVPHAGSSSSSTSAPSPPSSSSSPPSTPSSIPSTSSTTTSSTSTSSSSSPVASSSYLSPDSGSSPSSPSSSSTSSPPAPPASLTVNPDSSLASSSSYSDTPTHSIDQSSDLSSSATTTTTTTTLTSSSSSSPAPVSLSPSAEKDPAALPLLRLTYFCFFFSLGSLLPYLPVYYHQLSLPGRVIGYLGAITPFTTFVFSPLWGYLADFNNSAKSILLFCYTLSVLLRASMPFFAKTPDLLMLNVLLMSIFNAPVKSLLDSTSMSLIPRGSYGRLRLYGQLGFGVGSSGMGILLSKGPGSSLNFNNAFRLHFAASLPTIGIAWYLRKTANAEKKRKAIEEVAPKRVRPNFRAGLKLVLNTPTFLLFFFLTFTIGLNSGIIENFASIRMREVGGTGRDLSMSRFFSAAAGVPMFWHAGTISKKLGTPLVLTMTLVAYSLRFFIYSFSPSPFFMLPAEALRGGTFALFWSTITSFAYEISPQGMSSTMLALVNAMYGGIGQSLGALAGGFMQGRMGTSRMFFICGCGCLSFATVVGSSFAAQSFGKRVVRLREAEKERKDSAVPALAT